MARLVLSWVAMLEILNRRSPGLDMLPVSEIGNIPIILLACKVVSTSTSAMTSAVFVLSTTTRVGHSNILLWIANDLQSMPTIASAQLAVQQNGETYRSSLTLQIAKLAGTADWRANFGVGQSFQATPLHQR